MAARVTAIIAGVSYSVKLDSENDVLLAIPWEYVVRDPMQTLAEQTIDLLDDADHDVSILGERVKKEWQASTVETSA